MCSSDLAQMAIGFNYSRDKLVGVQVGLANASDDISGAQIGVLNFARLHDGLQVGAINMVRDHQGVPFGLVNYSRETGKADWITYTSNLSLINTGVRTTVNRFYSMLTLGGYNIEEDVEDTAFLNWNFGYEIPLSDAWGLGLDLGYVHIMPKASSDPTVNDRLHFATQARALAEVRLSPKFTLFAGVGFSHIFSEYRSGAVSELKPLGVLGISAF